MRPPDATPVDRAGIGLTLLVVTLLTLHLAQDIAYGFEPGNFANLLLVLVASVFVYLALAFTGQRLGYVVLLLFALLAPVIPIVHMSGGGVGEDIARSGGGVGLAFTTLALAVVGPATTLISVRALWRLRRGNVSFVVWSAIPLGLGGAGLSYIALPYLT